MMHVNTLNNEGTINNNTITQNNNQIVFQPQVQANDTTAETQPASTASAPAIRLNDKRGNRVNLYRVIAAMHAHGFFKSELGGPVDQQDVFAAFANMLGTHSKTTTRISARERETITTPKRQLRFLTNSRKTSRIHSSNNHYSWQTLAT